MVGSRAQLKDPRKGRDEVGRRIVPVHLDQQVGGAVDVDVGRHWPQVISLVWARKHLALILTSQQHLLSERSKCVSEIRFRWEEHSKAYKMIMCDKNRAIPQYFKIVLDRFKKV